MTDPRPATNDVLAHYWNAEDNTLTQEMVRSILRRMHEQFRFQDAVLDFVELLEGKRYTPAEYIKIMRTNKKTFGTLSEDARCIVSSTIDSIAYGVEEHTCGNEEDNEEN